MLALRFLAVWTIRFAICWSLMLRRLSVGFGEVGCDFFGMDLKLLLNR